jgi:hypothetical protein
MRALPPKLEKIIRAFDEFASSELIQRLHGRMIKDRQ